MKVSILPAEQEFARASLLFLQLGAEAGPRMISSGGVLDLPSPKSPNSPRGGIPPAGFPPPASQGDALVAVPGFARSGLPLTPRRPPAGPAGRLLGPPAACSARRPPAGPAGRLLGPPAACS